MLVHKCLLTCYIPSHEILILPEIWKKCMSVANILENYLSWITKNNVILFGG